MIHPTAIIHPGANIDPTVEVGPYAVIGENVSIDAGTWVGPHTVIEGWTEIGAENRIYQFASVGADPQDLKFAGEKSYLKIGDRNRIREFVTIHRGTEDGGGITRIANDCLLMAYAHVAHDCNLGSHVILANAATLAGHCEVDDYAILGGLSAVHQFTRIGCHVMISGGSMVAQDISPYCIAQGDRAEISGINLVGLKRRGFSEQALAQIKQVYKVVFRQNLRLNEAIEKLDGFDDLTAEAKVFVDFIRNSQRGIAR